MTKSYYNLTGTTTSNPAKPPKIGGLSSPEEHFKPAVVFKGLVRAQTKKAPEEGILLCVFNKPDSTCVQTLAFAEQMAEKKEAWKAPHQAAKAAVENARSNNGADVEPFFLSENQFRTLKATFSSEAPGRAPVSKPNTAEVKRNRALTVVPKFS